MRPDENWVAEQVRLLTLEDGFGPTYSTRSGPPANASDETETAQTRSSGA
jgi:hypothetical protein